MDSLEAGTQLQIGDATVTITKPRTGCDWFEKVQGMSPKDAAGRMGQMASVTATGEIRVGDAVQVVEAVTA